MINEQVRFLYEAGVTRRFHTIPVIYHQTIADHSWHLALLAHILYGQDEPGLTPAFLMACLTHDMAECRVGDLPAPGKRAMDERFQLLDAKEPVPDEHVTFREAWGEMEQELLSEYAMDWEKFLSEEEKRRLKFCDAMEGLFYCVKERRLGNRGIVVAFGNFTEYAGKLLENLKDNSADIPHVKNEWEVFELSQDLWRRASV